MNGIVYIPDLPLVPPDEDYWEKKEEEWDRQEETMELFHEMGRCDE